MSTPEEIVVDGELAVKSLMLKSINEAYSSKADDKQIAEYIREKMEEREAGKWNVVVGRDFASHVSHMSKKYGYYQLGEQSILVWKSG